MRWQTPDRVVILRRMASSNSGAGVCLRPFESDDLSLIDRAAGDSAFAGEFQWFGYGSSSGLRRRWEEDGLLGRSPYNLCVALDDSTCVGWVDWRDTDRAGPGVWEIGALVIPDYRGRGIGTAAHRLLVDHLFATTPAHRIWAGTEVGNIAEQKALDRSGFEQEGLLRGHHFRDGEWRDSYIYGLTRTDHMRSA